MARPGQPSRQMSLAEINLALASGEVLPEDQYWIKGMSRWESVSDVPGAIVPASPRTRPPVVASVAARPMSVKHTEPNAPRTSSGGPQEPLSFWTEPTTKPQLAVWSPVAYTLLSVFLTPLAGSILVVQNHRATEETAWRGIAWFWIVAWACFLAAPLGLLVFRVAPGHLEIWGAGYAFLSICWFFTCALPHRSFLQQRTFDAAWRSDWGKPAGVGFLAWVLVGTAVLLTH